MRRSFSILSFVAVLAACSKSNNVAVSGGAPGAELVGEACVSKDDCGGGECVAGFCRMACNTDFDCEAKSLCLSDGIASGCRLPDEAACSAARATCDKNAGLTCGLDKTCRTPCSSSCNRDDTACIAGACVGKHEPDVDGQGWFTCQQQAGFQGLFCGGDGTVLSSCNDTRPGAAVLESCASAGLCGQAVASNASSCPAAACTPGELACGGSGQGTLQTCKADGTGFVDYDASHDCATSSLCQVVIDQSVAQGGTIGACPSPACDAGQGRCQDDVAQQCNDGRTAFADVVSCGPAQQCSPLTRGCVSIGIDATEVTRRAYLDNFLSKSPSIQGQPLPACAQNVDFTPETDWPPTVETENLPVVSVDWCDAFAYCKAVGKRLCGSIGGTSVPKDKFADPGVSQWMNACSAGGQHAFPYGDTSTTACNGENNWLSNETPTSVAAGSMTGCQSAVPGYAGVFDLSGNVAEWEDACDSPASGLTDGCRIRGGSFHEVASKMACAADRQMPRGTRAVDIGFRCCD